VAPLGVKAHAVAPLLTTAFSIQRLRELAIELATRASRAFASLDGSW
jgi:hypothetical protein